MTAIRRIHPTRNLLRDLPGELTRRSDRPASVAVGWGADPYGPRERHAPLMPHLLAILADFGMPTTIRTASALIVRDLEPLARLARAANLRVSFRIATLDDVRVAARLARAGIDVDAALLHAIGGTLDRAIRHARIATEPPRQLRLFCHPELRERSDQSRGTATGRCPSGS